MNHKPASGESSDEPAAVPTGDYGYDEAHDFADAQGTCAQPAFRRVEAPPGSETEIGGDYEYDEAHDFGAR